MIRPGTAQEKQGDLSDLNQKTTAELQDLLARQQKLLANRKFLSRLQDKGARVECLAEKLEMLIKKRQEEVDTAAQLFEKMGLGQDDITISHVTERTPMDQSNDRIAVTEKKNTESLALRISGHSFIPGASPKEDKRGKFKPNKDLKSTVIPDGLPRPSIEPSKERGLRSIMAEEKEVEMSSAVVPPLRNQEAQVVQFPESADLLQEQKKCAEALVAKHAAERLTERLHIQMGDFIPQVPQGSHRGGTVDSDDDESEEDDDESEDDAGEENGD